MNDDTIFELSLHDNIIGIKDATNDLTRPLKLKKILLIKNFSVIWRRCYSISLFGSWRRWSNLSYSKYSP